MTARQAYRYFQNNYKIKEIELRSLLEFFLEQSMSEFLFAQTDIDSQKFYDIEKSILELQQGRPLAYILKSQDFYKLKLYVDERVLIPRLETEFLVDLISQKYLQSKKSLKKIMDIGAGSGCIGISLLKSFSDIQCVFVEKSLDAIEVLKKNLKITGVKASRFEIHQNLKEVCSKHSEFDLIVSNPPYIDEADIKLESNVKVYEPHISLFAADQGLDYLKKWSEISYKLLASKGEIYFEFGLGQEEEVCQYGKERSWDCKILKDQYGVKRFWNIKG